MPFIFPSPHHTQRQDWDTDPLRRGETNGGSLTHNTKSAGSLPVTAGNASASTNNSGSSATGNPAFAHLAFQSSGGLDVSSDTKLLIFLEQHNAANRIQVSTKILNGMCFRIGSGSGSPPSTYKHFQIGGRDTPLGKQNAGIRAILIDLNDTSNEQGNGSFNNTDVQTYAFGTVRHNIAGNSSNWYFRQPTYLLDTAKDAANIPKFTGLNSGFDEAVDLILGSTPSDILSYDWVSRNGNIISLYCPWQIGDGSTPTTFNSTEPKTIITPTSNDPNDPRNRLTNQAMRVYANMRNNAADSINFDGYTFIWGTAAPWDLNVNNASSISIEKTTFNGMGDITLGSSVLGAAIFSLNGSVISNNSNIDGSVINGDLILNTPHDLSNIAISGDLTINATSNTIINFSNVSWTGDLINAGSGTLQINMSNGSSGSSSEPGISAGQVNIVDNKLFNITGGVNPSKIIIYDVDLADPQDLGTELQRNNVSTGQEIFSYGSLKAGDEIVIRMIAPGYKTLIKKVILPIDGGVEILTPELETN